MKPTKSQRLNAIKEVLKTWGKIDKNTLNSRVSERLGLDLSNAFKRALYRDLEELCKNHEVNTHYFTRDLVPIEDYDPDFHKNVVCHWSLPSSDNEVLGGNLVRFSGGELFASSLIKNEVNVKMADGDFMFKVVHIFFQIGGSFLCVKVSQDALPFHFIISKAIQGTQAIQEFQDIQKKYSKRVIYLRHPSAFISRFKSTKSPGSFVIRFSSLNEMEIEKFEAKNPIEYSNISVIEANEIILKGTLGNSETLTSDILNAQDFNTFQTLKKTQDIVKPSLIKVGADFKMLVV